MAARLHERPRPRHGPTRLEDGSAIEEGAAHMRAARQQSHSSFVGFAWGTLAFTVAVVLWGAFVRATGSGAGCGAHWPLCNGEIVPRSPRLETLIELTHRLTSGASLVLVLALGTRAMRRFPAGHRVRRTALASVLFILSEALIGAGLVLFGLVADDRSEIRAVVLALHLTNTFLLLASLALTARLASSPATAWRRSSTVGWSLAALGAVLLVGITGAVTALGDTLFPATSLRGALEQDFSASAHLLVQLRVYHPLIAIVVSVALVAFTQRQQRRFPHALGGWPNLLFALVALQLIAGAASVLLLAPVWLQLVHLALADALWVTLVVLIGGILDAEASLCSACGYHSSATPTIAAPIGTRSLPNGPG